MSIPFSKLKNRWLKDPEFRKEYEALDEEFALARALIEARTKAGLTQEEVARRMGTTQPVVARLEGGHKPSLQTLERYAAATGSKLKIQLVPSGGPPLSPRHTADRSRPGGAPASARRRA